MNIVLASTADIIAVSEIDRKVIGNYSRKDDLVKALLNGVCLVSKQNESVLGFIILET